MGAALSPCLQHAAANSSHLAWHMPSWCVDKVVITAEHLELIKSSWSACMSGETSPFLSARSRNPTITPIILFYDTFYKRLFEWIPQVKPMFSNSLTCQGHMLAAIVRFIVQNLEEKDDAHFVENLTELTKVHNERGVEAHHYSIMGMTQIYTIALCMGDDEFTEEHRKAWTLVYSKMMSVMIPVSGERPNKAKLTQVGPTWRVERGSCSHNK